MMKHLKVKNLRIKEADDMPFERWAAYMMCHLVCLNLSKTHYITRDANGKSWIKLRPQSYEGDQDNN